MAARVAIVALCVTVVRAVEPTARINIVTQPRTYNQHVGIVNGHTIDVEKRYTAELIEDFRKTKTEALLLYTEYTAHVADDLRVFQNNISLLEHDIKATMQTRILDRASRHCREEYDNGIRKIVDIANRSAGFNAVNHDKYFRGHKIVFNIHLNKAECYIRRCEKILNSCGITCETIPRMIRWRRCAVRELNRVKDDIQHSRRSYFDLLSHSRRQLKKLRKEAELRANEVVAKVHRCVCTTTC